MGPGLVSRVFFFLLLVIAMQCVLLSRRPVLLLFLLFRNSIELIRGVVIPPLVGLVVRLAQGLLEFIVIDSLRKGVFDACSLEDQHALQIIDDRQLLLGCIFAGNQEIVSPLNALTENLINALYHLNCSQPWVHKIGIFQGIVMTVDLTLIINIDFSPYRVQLLRQLCI